MASQENSNFSHQSTLSGMFLRHTVIIWLPGIRLGTPPPWLGEVVWGFHPLKTCVQPRSWPVLGLPCPLGHWPVEVCGTPSRPSFAWGPQWDLIMFARWRTTVIRNLARVMAPAWFRSKRLPSPDAVVPIDASVSESATSDVASSSTEAPVGTSGIHLCTNRLARLPWGAMLTVVGQNQRQSLALGPEHLQSILPCVI